MLSAINVVWYPHWKGQSVFAIKYEKSPFNSCIVVLNSDYNYSFMYLLKAYYSPAKSTGSPQGLSQIHIWQKQLQRTTYTIKSKNHHIYMIVYIIIFFEQFLLFRNRIACLINGIAFSPANHNDYLRTVKNRNTLITALVYWTASSLRKRSNKIHSESVWLSNKIYENK